MLNKFTAFASICDFVIFLSCVLYVFFSKSNFRMHRSRCLCLDISDFEYFYILHIVGEIIVACSDTAAVDSVAAGADAADVAVAAVVVTMRSDTDVTSWWCRQTGGSQDSDSTSPDSERRQRVNWAAD